MGRVHDGIWFWLEHNLVPGSAETSDLIFPWAFHRTLLLHSTLRESFYALALCQA